MYDITTLRLSDPRYLKGLWELSKNALDSSGNNNHGTLSSEAYTAGPFGKDVLNKTTQISRLSINYTNSFVGTVSLWVFDTGLYNNIYIFDARTANVGTGYLYNAGGMVQSSGLLYINGKLNGAYTLNKWNHILVSGITISTTSFKFGSAQGGGDGPVGKMCNCRLYNVALSSQEVSALYKQEQQVAKLTTPISISDSSCQLYLWNGVDWAMGRQITNYKVQTGGGVMKFNGTDSKLSLPAFIKTNDFSLISWYKPTSKGASGYGTILIEQTITPITRLGVYIPNSTSLFVSSDSNSGGATIASASAIFNKWRCVSITRSGSTVLAYLDGVPVTLVGSTYTPSDALNCFIGGGWDGYLGPLAIYNRVMSAGEIKDWYDDTKRYF